jgi:archaellum component FlaG (FlaF/FlaG flagellin family)
MASYTRISSSIPLSGRTIRFTDVAAGDKIDILSALGKSATNLVFHMTDAADTVSYRINNLTKHKVKSDPTLVPHSFVSESIGVYNTEEVEYWSKASSYQLYEDEGEVVTVTGITIASIEIDALSLSTGTTIEIVAW